jgi:hypothetical protein
VSKSTAVRILDKLAGQGYLTIIPGSARRGVTIYLNNYLSLMFKVSDMMTDKEVSGGAI